MVRKYLLVILLFMVCYEANAEAGHDFIIKEIEDTFAEDILSSSEVYQKRKYYRKYPDEFEMGPAKLFLFHSNPSLTLKTILGENNFLKIPVHNRLELIQALTNTFRRYAYEWLGSNLNTSLFLKKIRLIDNKSAILIVERNMKVAPDLDFKIFIHKTDKGWKVYDFGFWDFRYTRMKRGLYLRYVKKDDFEGLVTLLKEKNTKFFK